MPAFVPVDNRSKVSNIKPFLPNLPQPKLSNLNNPFNAAGVGKLPFVKVQQPSRQEFKLPVPGEGLPRVIHYCADQSGCGFWRMIWPADEMLSQNKAVVMTLYQMVLLAPFYQGIDAIRLQRQCTEAQSEFVEFLRNVSNELKQQTGKGFRIIWEVDDICGPPECIPDYNVCKTAFTDPKIMETVKKIMKYVDEMVVVSKPMKEHYQKYLGFDKITVIPNYAPKYWLDIGHDEQYLISNLRKNRKKPRILYAGSATHFDLLNKTNQQDDFGHVVDAIIRDITTTKKYQWVFVGGIPMKLKQFVGNGIEFHNWTEITNYPSLLKSLDVNLMIAPLEDNLFSNCKANIKLTEAGALGIPMIAQNLKCYNSDGWQYLFNTAEEMFQEMSFLLLNEKNYRDAIRNGKEYANRYWLKDHVDEWLLLYTSEYGSDKRKENKTFYENNREQFN